MVLDALAAGKDVYVEKPLCRTPEEGARAGGGREEVKNIIQVGMQRRSYDLYLEGREIVASGTLGNVRMVRSWWLNNYLAALPRPSWMASWIGSSGKGPANIGSSTRTVFATGGCIRITRAASWRIRARTSSTAFIC